jgi:hypothetical protein
MILLHLSTPQHDLLAYPKPMRASGGDQSLDPLPSSPGDQHVAFWRGQQEKLSCKADSCLELQHEDNYGVRGGVNSKFDEMVHSNAHVLQKM